jgi:hypothetical protein
MTATPAVPDDTVAHGGPILTSEQLHEICFDFDGVILSGPAKSTRETTEMGVYRDARHPKRIAKNHVGGLAPDAGQGDEILEPTRHFSGVGVAQLLGHALQSLRLCPKETGGSNDVLDVIALGCRHGDSIGIGGKQRWRDGVDPLVGALRTQDGGYEKFERGCEFKFAACIGVGDP